MGATFQCKDAERAEECFVASKNLSIGREVAFRVEPPGLVAMI